MTNQKRRQWTAEEQLQIIEEARQVDKDVAYLRPYGDGSTDQEHIRKERIR